MQKLEKSGWSVEVKAAVLMVVERGKFKVPEPLHLSDDLCGLSTLYFCDNFCGHSNFHD